jgi:hypothetical protein
VVCGEQQAVDFHPLGASALPGEFNEVLDDLFSDESEFYVVLLRVGVDALRICLKNNGNAHGLATGSW